MAKKMKFPIQEAAGIIAGSIAAGFVSKMVNDRLPNVPNAVKAIIPIGAGLFPSGQKNTIVKMAGFGMIAKGGADLAKAFLPGIGAEMDNLLGSPADQSILSLPADQSLLSGEDFVGEDFVGEDFVGEDFVGEDFVGEDFVGEDFVGEDFVGEDAVLLGEE
jgi:hypothetical protein